MKPILTTHRIRHNLACYHARLRAQRLNRALAWAAFAALVVQTIRLAIA